MSSPRLDLRTQFSPHSSKQAVSLGLDADVVAWLKKRGKGYQTRANQILRERMLADMRKLRA